MPSVKSPNLSSRQKRTNNPLKRSIKKIWKFKLRFVMKGGARVPLTFFFQKRKPYQWFHQPMLLYLTENLNGYFLSFVFLAACLLSPFNREVWACHPCFCIPDSDKAHSARELRTIHFIFSKIFLAQRLAISMYKKRTVFIRGTLM